MSTGSRTRSEPREPARRTPSTERPSKPTVPILHNGDRLTAPEFERRYNAMPNLKKAELIEGVVYIPSPDFYPPEGVDPAMTSPVSFGRHANPHFNLITWLGLYGAMTPGVAGGDNGSIRLDIDNMPQPDVFLIIRPEHGGQARIGEDDYVEGAPELVAEVAYSSVSYDLHDKLNAYRRNNVREYVVWRVLDEAVDWFVLREGRYDPLPSTAEGQYHSEVFPGLWLDPAALVRGDMATVLQVAQQGIAAPEHAAFVDGLRRAAAGPEGPQQQTAERPRDDRT